MTTHSTRITVPITDANGGMYTITYERPGMVTQADVEHDLAELAANLVSHDAEIGEAGEVVGRRGPTTVPGETTTHVRICDGRSVIVNVMDRDAVVDYFDGTADEAVRVMLTEPGSDEPTSVFVSIYEHGGWTISYDGDVTVDV